MEITSGFTPERIQVVLKVDKRGGRAPVLDSGLSAHPTWTSVKDRAPLSVSGSPSGAAGTHNTLKSEREPARGLCPVSHTRSVLSECGLFASLLICRVAHGCFSLRRFFQSPLHRQHSPTNGQHSHS